MTKWRDRIKVHPAADMFPMISDAELDELATDIQKNGNRVGIVLWTPEYAIDVRPRKGPHQLYLLDGRNRLEAIERAYADADPDYRESAFDEALSWDEQGTAKLIF